MTSPVAPISPVLKTPEQIPVVNAVPERPSFLRRLLSAALAAIELTGRALAKVTKLAAQSVGQWLNPPRQSTASERLAAYEAGKEETIRAFRAIEEAGHQVAAKSGSTSHLFRPRNATTKKLSLTQFNQVISIDSEAGVAHVGGSTMMYDLVAETIKHGFLPKVVPELGGITVGGAVSGLAVESSSFKQGLFHYGVQEMEVLTGEGIVRTIRADAEDPLDRELYHGMPNSYGTLGYILSAKIELVPAKPYVKVEHRRFDNLQEYFEALEKCCKKKEEYDFVDGAIFATDHCVLTLGTFTDTAPFTSNYRPEKIYYESVRDREEVDYLTSEGYIWRWDTDCFWSPDDSEFGHILRNPTLRRLAGTAVFRSSRLIDLNRFMQEVNERVIKPLRAPDTSGTHVEPLTQDVGIPVRNCAEYIEWFAEEIGIFPIFVCPFETPEGRSEPCLFHLDDGGLSCDIGFFNGKESTYEEGYYNRMVEEKVTELDGRKALYSGSFYEQEEFDRLYDGESAKHLKELFDPRGRFPTMYEKCVKNR